MEMLQELRASIDLGEKILGIEGIKIPIYKMFDLKGQGATEKGENAKLINVFNGERTDEHIVKSTTYVMNTSFKKPDELLINCPSKYDKMVQNLLCNYSSLINYEPRVAKGYVHKLEVDNDKPFKSKTYPIPFKYKKQVQNEITNMIKSNIIESAKTNYINPVVIVKKKDESIRLCLDARSLNLITKGQFDAPQTIDTMLYRVGKNTIFSKLDLKNSFWLIPLHPDSRRYTGFSVDGHIFQFKVVPFGLQSASSALVRAMQTILDKGSISPAPRHCHFEKNSVALFCARFVPFCAVKKKFCAALLAEIT